MRLLSILRNAVIIILECYTPCFAQTGSFLIGSNLDLVKTGNDGFFEKVQAGAEVNYFMTPAFTATGGFEWWTREGTSVVAGARWYPAKEAFLRFRGLIGADDISLGGGWAKPVSKNLNFEAITDVYFRGDIAIRAGITYFIARKPT
jgi:hypothetical protein